MRIECMGALELLKSISDKSIDDNYVKTARMRIKSTF